NSASRIEGELSVSQQPGEIEHHFVSVTADTKVETLVEHIRSSSSTLVFVRTKRGADRLVQKLARQGVTAAAMHGDMTQNARERALARFETGKVVELVLEPGEGLRLQLPDALAGDPKLAADLLQRRGPLVEAEAQLEDPRLPLGQPGNRTPNGEPPQRVGRLRGRVESLRIREQVSELAVLLRPDR